MNSKVLTYSAQDKAYRVWEMTNYDLLYTLPDEDVTEIKISPGIMLLIHQRQGGVVPLKILSIEDGSASAHPCEFRLSFDEPLPFAPVLALHMCWLLAAGAKEVQPPASPHQED